MAFDKFKKMFNDDEDELIVSEGVEEDYYNDAYEEGVEGGKMVLVEPRAYSESQQIADYLKNRNTVVVNLKRVTSEQAKRIVDFLSGTVYAIGGEMQKVGGGIFLCAPKNINVEGSITENDEKEETHDNADIDVEW